MTCKTSSHGADLAPIPWTLPALTPLPEVILDDSEEAWRRWDSAKATQDAKDAR